MFQKRYRRAVNPLRRLYLLQVVPFAVTALCIPLFPGTIPMGEGAVSRYLLLVLPALVFVLGILALRRIRVAAIEDDALRKKGKEAMNASTSLFFSTLLMGFLDALILVFLFMAAHQTGITFAPVAETYRQVAAIAVGLTLLYYGYFLPLVPHGHVMGFQTPYTLSSPETWRMCHMRCRRVLLPGGAVVLGVQLFLYTDTWMLAGSVLAAFLLLLFCYVLLCKKATGDKEK